MCLCICKCTRACILRAGTMRAHSHEAYYLNQLREVPHSLHKKKSRTTVKCMLACAHTKNGTAWTSNPDAVPLVGPEMESSAYSAPATLKAKFCVCARVRDATWSHGREETIYRLRNGLQRAQRGKREEHRPRKGGRQCKRT